MSFLNKVQTGKIKKPFLMLLYGVEGVGKSSFAAQAPNPIFLCAEDGTENLDVARLPAPQSWNDVLGMLKELRNSNHKYETLVIDTLDWLEMSLHKHLLRGKPNTATIQDLGAFGAYVEVVNKEWLLFINEIKELRKKMNILFLAHSEVKRFNDPQGNVDYDRFELKMYVKKSAALFKEFVDCLLFANFEVNTKQDALKKTRAYSDGTRIIYTEKRASHDAKNRFSVPYELPLNFGDVYKYINRSDSECLNAELEKINEMKNRVDDDLKRIVDEQVSLHSHDLVKIKAISNRLSQRIGAQ